VFIYPIMDKLFSNTGGSGNGTGFSFGGATATDPKDLTRDKGRNKGSFISPVSPISSKSLFPVVNSSKYG
jgi:hypothetical protein